MGDWKPDARLDVHSRVLYRWTVSAWVEGCWDCVADAPGGRRRMVLRLKRTYQVLSGTARVARRDLPVVNATLAGSSLSFSVPDDSRAGGVVRFTGDLRGGSLRGTCEANGWGRPAPWGAVRRAR